MRIGAVVLHYRHWPGIQPVIERLLGGSRPPDLTVVVDNHSADASPAAIRGSFPGVELVEAPTNLGYAGGMNLGIGRVIEAGMDGVLLVTHDCVLARSALARMEARLGRAPGVGVVGPLTALASRPEEVFAAGCSLDPHTWETKLGADPGTVEGWAGRPPMACDWLTGSCLLFRTSAIEQVGPMDERFFLYFEEVDYQLRLREAGWGVECVPSALAWQEPGFIPLELWVRNRLLLLALHAPGRVLARETRTQLRASAVELRRGEIDRLTARLRGAARFALRSWGPPRPAGRRPVVRR